jgi:hypothetical protein
MSSTNHGASQLGRSMRGIVTTAALVAVAVAACAPSPAALRTDEAIVIGLMIVVLIWLQFFTECGRQALVEVTVGQR